MIFKLSYCLIIKMLSSYDKKMFLSSFLCFMKGFLFFLIFFVCSFCKEVSATIQNACIIKVVYNMATKETRLWKEKDQRKKYKKEQNRSNYNAIFQYFNFFHRFFLFLGGRGTFLFERECHVPASYTTVDQLFRIMQKQLLLKNKTITLLLWKLQKVFSKAEINEHIQSLCETTSKL